MVERAVREAGEIRDRLACELSDVSAGELFLGGSALLAAAVFGLAGGAAPAGVVASGSGHSGLLWGRLPVKVASGPVGTGRSVRSLSDDLPANEGVCDRSGGC